MIKDSIRIQIVLLEKLRRGIGTFIRLKIILDINLLRIIIKIYTIRTMYIYVYHVMLEIEKKIEFRQLQRTELGGFALMYFPRSMI